MSEMDRTRNVEKSPFLSGPSFQGTLQGTPKSLAVHFYHDDRVFERKDLHDITKGDFT
jgi:hypothetical protein